MTKDNILNTEGSMFVYLWEEIDKPGECKFGERWVFFGQDPEKECLKRIRESLGVRKDKFDEGGIRLVAIWNVSDVAEKVGRNYQRSRMDDYLREFIGFRKGSTGEIHKLNGTDMKLRVNRLLAKLGQPLMTAALSTKQYQVASEVINMFGNGMKVILAELAARFGKTIWSGAVAVETKVEVVVVASYVKTVFTSFATDITSFQQFAEYEHIDASGTDYQQKITDALSAERKVFVYLSLANGSKRQERIDFLFNLPNSKMLIVDEADFGAHQSRQAQPLIDKLDSIDYTIIMTGTNADRAATHWPVDGMVSVTYPELLIQKKASQNA